VGQDERGSLLDRELQERPLELVTVDELSEAILERRLFEHVDDDLHRPSAPLPNLVLAGIDEQPMQPSVEAVAIAQTAKVTPGPDERVLHGIFRGIPIAEDPPRDRVQAVVCGGREGIKCLVVAPLCALDELGRHPSPLGPARELPALPSMALAKRDSFIVGW